MELLPKIVMSGGRPSIYDTESATAIEMVATLYGAMNQLISEVNETMANELKDSIQEILDDEGLKLLQRVVSDHMSGKVDKNGNEQITLAMLSQEIKSALTGGSVAVVGEGAVNTSNIVDKAVTGAKLARSMKPVHLWAKKEFITGEDCYFNIDSVAGTVTPNDITASFSVNDRTFNIDFGTVLVSVVELGNSTGVFYNESTNQLTFDVFGADRPDEYFLGLISPNKERIHNSTCVLAYSVDNQYFFYPDKKGREYSFLNVAFVRSYETNIKPYVDFVNRCLVFPPFSSIHAMYKNRYITIEDAHTEPLTIPFGDASSYIYLVGGVNGLKFVSSSEFNATYSKYDNDQFFYFGFINESLKKVSFSFECGIAKSVSILGDSISTFAGHIPTGNVPYYDGTKAGVSQVNQTWWKRVLGEKGYTLNLNNSYSGASVTTGNGSAGVGTSGVERARNLDNGTNPDIILVYMGINDFNRNVTLDDFKAGYSMMISNAQKKYKTSMVYVCTLPPCQRNYQDIDNPEFNSNGLYLYQYNDTIREVARMYNASVIDLESCGLTNFNGDLYMGDYDSENGGFLHPNANGHKLIADCVVKAIK